MRSQDWKQLVGRIIHGNICHWLVMKESSIFSARKSTSFRIQCCALERFTKNPESKKKSWQQRLGWLKSSSKLQKLWQNRWEANGIRVEYFPGFNTLQLSHKVQEFTVQIRRNTTKLHRNNSILCRCWTTFLVEQKTMKKNAWQTLDSFLYIQEHLEEDNGHSLVLVLRKSAPLSVRTVHKESWAKLQKGCCWNSLRADVELSVLRPHCPEVNSKKQRTWKTIDTLCSRPGNDWDFRKTVSANQLSLYGAIAEIC